MEQTQEQAIAVAPLGKRLEQLSSKIEKLAVKVMKIQGIVKTPLNYGRFQYYYFKNETMELITDISTDIEVYTEEEKRTVDSRIIFDSFNDQIKKLHRIIEDEDRIQFSQNQTFYNKKEDQTADGAEEEKKLDDDDEIQISLEDQQAFDIKIESEVKREKAQSIALLKLSLLSDGSQSLSDEDLQELNAIIQEHYLMDAEKSWQNETIESIQIRENQKKFKYVVQLIGTIEHLFEMKTKLVGKVKDTRTKLHKHVIRRLEQLHQLLNNQQEQLNLDNIDEENREAENTYQKDALINIQEEYFK